MGGGMHGGFAGGGHVGGGHVGGVRSFSGVRSGGMHSSTRFSQGPNHSFHHGSSQDPFLHSGFHNHQFHNHGFHNNCFGTGCSGWGGWGWGWGYDPWWSSWDDQDRRFDEDYYRQYEMANEWNRQNLAEQRMLRQEEADGDDDSYAPRSSGRQSAPSNASQPQEPVPATVLVFRDQHKEEISNYAIVGQTLMSYSAQRTKKIPLADLDVAATEKANDDRGVTFRVPGTHEGQ